MHNPLNKALHMQRSIVSKKQRNHAKSFSQTVNGKNSNTEKLCKRNHAFNQISFLPKLNTLFHTYLLAVPSSRSSTDLLLS